MRGHKSTPSTFFRPVARDVFLAVVVQWAHLQSNVTIRSDRYMNHSFLSSSQGRIRNILAILVLLLITFSPAAAVRIEQAGFPSKPYLRITGVDVGRLPMIQLRVIGRAADGAAIDFNTQPVTINHGSEQISQVEIGGQEDVGSLTIFVVDTPAGIEDQLPAIQAVLSEYASPNSMREQVDYVAIYQVGSLTAQQLLEPTPFYNTITNFLLDPLPIAEGPTALIDSLTGLLNSADALRPDPALDVSLVVVSDGTDVVSSQFSEGDLVDRAVQLGIPIHTILIDNVSLFGGEDGRRFLDQVARVSGGVSTQLSSGDAAPIWERVSQFRSQTLLQYQLATPKAGENIPVLVSLTDTPEVQSGTTVSISPAAALLTLAVPADSRTITVPDLADPLRLQLPAVVSWLDEEERELTALQLWSNGAPLADINPGDIGGMDVSITNLRYGANQLWLTAVDNSGREMASPPVILTVIQGDALAVPELIQPQGISLSSWLLGCLGGLALLAVLAGWFFLRGTGRVNLGALSGLLSGGGGRRPRRRARPVSEIQPDYDLGRDPPPSSEPGGFELEIIEAVSPLSSPIMLQNYEIHIGRAPSQADVVFEQDLTVSRRHGTMVREGHTYRIFDEESTSGILVNGQHVPEYGALLIDGDEIQMGAVRLRFRVIWEWAP